VRTLLFAGLGRGLFRRATAAAAHVAFAFAFSWDLNGATAMIDRPYESLMAEFLS
jgi:hypothetical protein